MLPISLPAKPAALQEAEADLAALTECERKANELAAFVADKVGWSGLVAPDGTLLPMVTEEYVGECFVAHHSAQRAMEPARQRVASSRRAYAESAAEELEPAVLAVRQEILRSIEEIEGRLARLSEMDRAARTAGFVVRGLASATSAHRGMRHLKEQISR